MSDPAALAADRQKALVLCPVSRETEERLSVLVEELRRWQRVKNLVGPATLDRIWTRHVADSLQLLDLAPESARTWLDLGSGAGFPGLVIAIAVLERVPGAVVHLVESNGRKCAFLRHAARLADAPAAVHEGRIEEEVARLLLPPCGGGGREATGGGRRREPGGNSASTPLSNSPPQGGRGQRGAMIEGSAQNPNPSPETEMTRIDVVTARALAPLAQLFAWTEPLLTTGAVGLFPKGRGVEAELTEAAKSWTYAADLLPSRIDSDGRIVRIRSLSARR